MNELKLEKLLQVKYIKLHFTLEVIEDCVLPKYKSSALRGGMGEMLLRVNCISNRNCEICEYEPECIVRRIIYSKMRIKPYFMTSGDSVGYVINCENYKRNFKKGDYVEFDMILFGRMIVYFGQILQAFQMLGIYGIGKDEVKFRIVRIANSRRETVMDGENVYMPLVKPMYISDYVSYRINKVNESDKLVFYTPLSLKCQGVYCKEFNICEILKSAERRIYMLNCYEGIETERLNTDDYAPILLSQIVKESCVCRFSSTHDQRIALKGIVGEVKLAEVRREAMELLLAGELVHIGKNTSFGFGKYIVK